MKPSDVKLPIADEFKAYNYIMLMSSGNIKIGLTTDPIQRIKSLSNSNSGGFRILDVYFSPQHILADRMEKVLHWVFRKYRVEGEFFNGCDYHSIIRWLEDKMESDDYKTAVKGREVYIQTTGHNLTDYRKRKDDNDKIQTDKCKPKGTEDW